MASVFPLLSRQLADDRAAAERTLRATARAFSTLGVPLAAGGLVIAPELARLAGGDEFAAAADPLRLLLCAAALAYLSGLLRLRADRGRARSARRCGSSLAALVVNLALNVALAPALRRRPPRPRSRSAPRRCCSPAAGCSCAAGSACAAAPDGALRAGRSPPP